MSSGVNSLKPDHNLLPIKKEKGLRYATMEKIFDPPIQYSPH